MIPCHAVLFDIDDTLVDFQKSETASLSKCYERYFKNWVNFEQFHIDYSRINHSLWKLVEQNKISPAILRKERFKQVAEHYGMSDSLEISSYYQEQLIQNSCWVSGAPELLTELKGKNIKLGFVTNGFSYLQKSKYNKLKLAQYSDILVISEEIGFSKPHPHIFFHALNLTNTDVKHTLMVGDSLTSDGEGARSVGMPFCWYNPKQAQHNLDWEPNFIISNLMSLLDIMT
jgi:2-haloacid dehalogenase